MKIERVSLVQAIVAVAIVLAAAALLVPGLATIVGRMIANLWVTVMGAVAAILGGLMGM